MDILVEGVPILDDDDHLYNSVPRLDAPNSAPHSRSSSFKNRPRPKLSLDITAAQRPRTNSLPNAYLPLPDPFLAAPTEGGLRRVRSFKTTSKGLVNHGDIKRSTNSLRSLGSAGSINDLGNASPRRVSNTSLDSPPDSHEDSRTALDVYRVLMMGGPGVGKTALTRQFMTSEYKGTYSDNTPDIIEVERSVNVLLDGKESTLQFVHEEQFPNFEEEEIPIDAYVVVFAVSDIYSFNDAIKSIKDLRHVHGTNKAVILVGNKCDLARQRRVSKHDGLRVAKRYDCRYIETSVALNHHVDELLVGILSQIRQQICPPSPQALAPPKQYKHRSRSKSPGRAITDFFSKIFQPSDKKAKSCETLFVQ